jgi:hypothetical protein
MEALSRQCFGRPGCHPVFRVLDDAGSGLRVVRVDERRHDHAARRTKRAKSSIGTAGHGTGLKRFPRSVRGRRHPYQTTCFDPALSLVTTGISNGSQEMSHYQDFRVMEPTGIEPVTSCLQRNPPARAKWRDLLGIHPPGPRTSRVKARFVSRDFAGRWSTEVGAWTSRAARWPRVLLGATDAPRR